MFEGLPRPGFWPIRPPSEALQGYKNVFLTSRSHNSPGWPWQVTAGCWKQMFLFLLCHSFQFTATKKIGCAAWLESKQLGPRISFLSKVRASVLEIMFSSSCLQERPLHHSRVGCHQVYKQTRFVWLFVSAARRVGVFVSYTSHYHSTNYPGGLWVNKSLLSKETHREERKRMSGRKSDDEKKTKSVCVF